jgi:hypothetical protein
MYLGDGLDQTERGQQAADDDALNRFGDDAGDLDPLRRGDGCDRLR